MEIVHALYKQNGKLDVHIEFASPVFRLLLLLAVLPYEIRYCSASSKMGSGMAALVAKTAYRSHHSCWSRRRPPNRSSHPFCRGYLDSRIGTQPSAPDRRWNIFADVIFPHTANRAEWCPATAAMADGPARVATLKLDGILAPVKERVEVGEKQEDQLNDMMLYFAFGANMCPSILVDKRGVKPLDSFPAEAIKFASSLRPKVDVKTRDQGEEGGRSRRRDHDDGEGGVCMCFCHRAVFHVGCVDAGAEDGLGVNIRSRGMESFGWVDKRNIAKYTSLGYATLAREPGPPQSWEPSPGAHGVVHVISSTDMEKIATFETGYQKCSVVVETPKGARDVAICFVSNPSQMLPTSVPPTSRYLALLEDGAAYYGVNERYRSWLRRLPSVPPEMEATSPERINTPSKLMTDAVVTTLAVAASTVAVAAMWPL